MKNEIAIREKLAYFYKTILAGYTGLALLVSGFAGMLFAGRILTYWPLSAAVIFAFFVLIAICVTINVKIIQLIRQLEV